MATQEFDKKFQQLCTEMVEIAYEFVDYNEEEVEAIHIYGSMEANTCFYNVFYRINGEYVRLNKVNTASKMQYDASEKRAFQLLDLGNDYLLQMKKLFISDEREIPTQLKMTYSPKTGEFDNQISYEPHFSKDFQCSNGDVFDAWFEEIKQQQA